MADQSRDDREGDGQQASRTPERDHQEQRDELARRRERGTRPPLTSRERNERWPVG